MLNINHPEHVYNCSFVQFLKPLWKQDPKNAENVTFIMASSYMLFSKHQTTGWKANLLCTLWQWRHSSIKMLFYGDSAANKKIIHLSDHINTKWEICFQKGCKIEEAFAILIYLEKKFYNPVHRLKAFIAPQVFSVENTHWGPLWGNRNRNAAA